MKNNVPLEKRYRFRLDGDGVHYFESRYYAQKYLDDVLRPSSDFEHFVDFDRYQIFKVGEEFCIVFFKWY